MHPSRSIFLALLTTICHALPFRERAAIHESRGIDATRLSRVDRNAILPLRIGLKQENLDDGYEHLLRVADPASPAYGKHWSKEEVESMYAPSSQTVNAVKRWLVAAGIPNSTISQSLNQGWLALDIPVWQAEALLGATYYEYESKHDGTLRIGCHEYSLPPSIAQYVDYVKPGVNLSPPLRKTRAPRRHSAHESHKDDVFSRTSALTQHSFRSVPLSNLTTNVNETLKTTSDNITANKHDVLHTRDMQKASTHHESQIQKPFESMPLANVTNGMPALASAVGIEACRNGVTPNCIRALYNIPRVNSTGNPNNLGLWESGGAYSQSDLDQYFAKYAKYVPTGSHPVLKSVNGATAPATQSQAQGESDLDLDILFSLNYPEPITLYQVASVGLDLTNAQAAKELTFLTTFWDAIDGAFCTAADRSSGTQCGVYNLTNVLSISYLSNELSSSQLAQRRTCHEIMKLGLQGHTVLSASGDYGVAGHPDKASGYNGCVGPNLNANGPQSGNIFNPSFPGNCPYVLSVGATQLEPNSTDRRLESVMDVSQSLFSSGGGFSNYFSRPDYQKAAVATYLEQYAPPYPSYAATGLDKSSGKSSIGANSGVFNRVGRAYPDVAAIGTNFPAFIKGQLGTYLGTSLATPLWASVIAMINAERMRNGKSTVGFVHPVLYEHPEVFNDITTGSSSGCGTTGFPAAPAWDPATGLGTPNYPALRDLFLSLP